MHGRLRLLLLCLCCGAAPMLGCTAVADEDAESSGAAVSATKIAAATSAISFVQTVTSVHTLSGPHGYAIRIYDVGDFFGRMVYVAVDAPSGAAVFKLDDAIAGIGAVETASDGAIRVTADLPAKGTSEKTVATLRIDDRAGALSIEIGDHPPRELSNVIGFTDAARLATIRDVRTIEHGERHYDLLGTMSSDGREGLLLRKPRPWMKMTSSALVWDLGGEISSRAVAEWKEDGELRLIGERISLSVRPAGDTSSELLVTRLPR